MSIGKGWSAATQVATALGINRCLGNDEIGIDNILAGPPDHHNSFEAEASGGTCRLGDHMYVMHDILWISSNQSICTCARAIACKHMPH